MDADARLDLEERLHALLCDEPGPDERLALLALVSRDEGARRLLREMLQVQEQARAACGYDEAADVLRRSMESVLLSVARAAESAAAPDRLAAPSPRVPGRRTRARWALRAAAAIVVLASVFVAVMAMRAAQRIEQKLAVMERALSMPRLSAAEVASYREIWQHVVEGPAQSRPWVLLGEGVGRFGYLPPADAAGSGAGLLLLRCQMVTAEGRVLETFNVLVPPGGRTRLSLPEAGRLRGLPVHCEVAAQTRGATLGVMVGTEPADSVGVKGRVRVGQGPVDLGQFRMDGDKVHVIFQAVPLAGSLG